MGDKKKEYLIDIASQSQYQNQNDEYHKAYTEWRMNAHNRFGYKFVKDTREHAYVEGEGFRSNDASDTERRTLRDLSALLGGTLLIAALIRLIQVIFTSRLGDISDGISVRLTGDIKESFIFSTVLSSAFKPVSFILCIVLFQSFIRLPGKVILPKGKYHSRRQAFEIIMTFCGLSVVCFQISTFFEELVGSRLIITPGGFVWTDNVWLNIYCFFVEYILTAALHAVFFNGLILQSLRQFGDSAAIVVTVIVETITALTIANFGVVIVISLMLCNITIKTGSVTDSFIARVLNNMIFFSLKFIGYNTSGSNSKMIQLIICIVILITAAICLGRLMVDSRWSFRIQNVRTELAFSEKMKTIFTALPMIEWLAASVIAWLYIFMV